MSRTWLISAAAAAALLIGLGGAQAADKKLVVGFSQIGSESG
ncbi:hypothetical protein [Azospirillum aestuarii]|nr:hypothetical protein [Azospirillum aestuarii]